MTQTSEFDERWTELRALGPLGKLRAKVTTAISDMWARHRLARQIDDIASSVGLERFLEDTGLSLADLESIVEHHPRSARLFDAMLHRLGIDPASAALRPMKRDMERTCSTCGEPGKCEHWLRSGATAGYDEFCPNAEILEDLAARH
jgi:hypothetical protein